jgi:indolepyruvate ferredoxin oxidoreductase beta subunit
MTKRRVSILLAGVGGQGLITLASTLARAAVSSGTKALVAETHGLSQRGGSVEVHVRLGDVYSPLIALGDADAILGLELIETARRVRYLKPGGLILSSDAILRPAVPNVKVPSRDELAGSIRRATSVDPILIPARELARRAGGGIYANTVMLGALMATGLLDGLVPVESVERVIRTMRRSEENLKAFHLGFDYCALNCSRTAKGSTTES